MQITENLRKGYSELSAMSYPQKRQMVKDIYKNSNGIPRLLQSLGLNDGENLNNIVTAVGTAAVAPIFIRYNPISHESKETKGYSAMRQPISAIIALAVQLPVMNAYNNLVDKHATLLGIEKMDLASKPQAAFLKPIVKKQYEYYKSEKIKKGEEYIKKSEWMGQKITEYQDKAFYDELSRLRTSMDASKIKDFDLVKPEDFKTAKKLIYKEVLIKDFNLRESDLEDLKEVDKIKSKCKRLFKEKNIKYADVAEKINERATEFSIALVKENMDREAKVKLKTSIYLDTMQTAFETEKSKIYNNLGSAKNDPKALRLAEKRVDDLKEEIYNKVVKKLKEESTKYAEGTDEHTVIKRALKKLENSGCIDKIKNHGLSKAEVERSVKIKQYLTSKINKAELNLSQFKKITGIVVGLAILPVTCGILNWAYPRIMEKYFPELAAAKKAKNDAFYRSKPIVKEAK